MECKIESVLEICILLTFAFKRRENFHVAITLYVCLAHCATLNVEV